MENQTTSESNVKISLVFPVAKISERELQITQASTASFPYQIIVIDSDINQTIKKLFQNCCDRLNKKELQLENSSLLEQSYDRLFAQPDLPTKVRQLENITRYYCCLWIAWSFYSQEKYAAMTRYLLQSLQYGDSIPTETICNWVSFLGDRELSPADNLIYSSQFARIPGWQQLVEQTLTIKPPTVSVIIPSYNCARYLPEAIASVLNQTYTDYEIIVIDDGSQDDTQEVIQPYLAKIRYLYQENQGVSEARNHGLYVARGELIAYLDADDAFLPHKLQEQVAIFNAQPHVGIVNSGFRIVKENGEPVMDIERWHEIPDLTPEVWLLHKPVLPSAMMFRREWFDRYGGFDRRLFSCEDVEITLRMVIKGCQATWLRSVTVCYRRHDRSASWFNVLRQVKNAEAMQDYFFARTDLPESIRQLESKFRFYNLAWLAWLCYQGGLFQDMAEYLTKSQKYASYFWVEIIVNWINTFSSCAKIYACDFDAYALTNLTEWQQVVANLKTSPLLHSYQQEISKAQQLFTYQPDRFETVLYGQTYFQLGERLIQQQDLEPAITSFRKAIELDSKNAWYHHALANALRDRYDLDAAIATYQRAIRLQPDCQQFQQNLELTLQLKSRWQKLLDYCQQNTKNNFQPDRLKMLMIFPFPPYPPQKGGAAMRMFEQIKYFGSRHQLTVVSLIFNESDYEIEAQLAPYCDRAFMVKLGVQMSPYRKNIQHLLYHLKTWNMWQTLLQLSQVDFDVVFFDFIFSTIYHDLFGDRLTILNEHNIESQLLQRCATADSAAIITNLARELDAAKPFLDAEPQAKLLAEYEQRTW